MSNASASGEADRYDPAHAGDPPAAQTDDPFFFEAITPPDATVRAGILMRSPATVSVPAAAETSTRGRERRAPPGAARLRELTAWVGSCQGLLQPRPVRRARVLVFAADHGVSARDVSAHRPGSTHELCTAVARGDHPLGVYARCAGAGLRVIDMGLEHDLVPGTGGDGFPAETGGELARPAGAIDVTDALEGAAARAAVRTGRELADAEVDSGADLLVASGLGVGGSTTAAALVAALTGAEPVAVVGRGSGIDDRAWMRKTAVVRDALHRARAHRDDPAALLRMLAGAEHAALAGFLAQAALRRTPVLLDGLAAAAGAVLAERLAIGARHWWRAPARDPEPAHALALEHLDTAPLFDLHFGTGAGAAVIPLIVMVTTAAAEQQRAPATG